MSNRPPTLRYLFDGPPSERTVEIAVLVLPEFSNLTLAGLVEPLRVANRLSGHGLYRWRLLSADGAAVVSSSGLPLGVAGALEVDPAVRALFVVASYNVERYVSRDLLARLRGLRRLGCQFAGFESGSYVLARAGLLDGYRATTHWEDLEDFAARYPAVEVVPDRYVIDRGRFTTGGATPGLDMMLQLIQVQQGYSLALDVAGMFFYEQARAAADPQRIVSLGRLRWRDPALAAAIGLMEAQIEEPLALAEIARRVGVTPRHLQRAFRATLGVTPRRYYRDLRVSVGRRLLQQSRQEVAEVALACGFASGSAFARAYRAKFGTAPRASRAAG